MLQKSTHFTHFAFLRLKIALTPFNKYAYNRVIGAMLPFVMTQIAQNVQKGIFKMNDTKIAVIGGDMRQSYLTDFLENADFTVSAYGVKGYEKSTDTLEGALSGAYAAVLPYPISPDGVYLNSLTDIGRMRLTSLFSELERLGIRRVIGGGFKPATASLAELHGLKIYDFGTSESVLIKNALCTAEGAIEIAMRELPINLQGSVCAVIGYGRIGRLLAVRLKALGASVCVFARRSEAISGAESDGLEARGISELSASLTDTDVIFNTVPSLILNKEVLLSLRADALIIDLASAPGGVDFAEVERLSLKVIWALSLPGKCSPKSAAEIIGKEIISHLKTERGNGI